MSTASETTIRRQLAQQLNILESELTLVEEEHHLPNAYGGKGFVDIWARDAHGLHVIVELKRSNTSARQALHEIVKYVALFRLSHGIPTHKIRCLIVSTEWHELLVPFTEFRQRTEIQTEGFQLDVDSAGTPVSASRVELPNLPPSLRLFRLHSHLIFQKEATRDAVAHTVDETLKSLGADGYLVLSMNYSEDDPAVIYRFGLYVVPASLTPDTLRDVERIVREERDLSDSDPIDQSDIEEEFLSRIVNLIQEPVDEYASASPEVYAAMHDQGWRRTAIIRRGQLASTQAYSDQDLDRLIVGSEGANSIIFIRIAKPANQLDWRQATSDAAHSLEGNDAWSESSSRLFKIIETDFPDSEVLINIYNPLCLPETLYNIAAKNDFGWVPTFDVAVRLPNGNRSWLARGIIQWDGKTCPASPESFFNELSNDVEEFYIRRQVNAVWPLDAKAMALHGFTYGVVKMAMRPGIIEAELMVAPPDSWTTLNEDVHVTNIRDFVDKNGDYLRSFSETLDRFIFRM